MGDKYDYDYEARARYVDLEEVTSSEYNAYILEMLRHDYCKDMGILGVDYDWPDENDFVVRDGDHLGWLGYFIGKSEQLKSLWISHLPGDDSLSQGLARNKSIQRLDIYSDLGRLGFQSLANFFRITRTLNVLSFTAADISRLECAQNIALLLSQTQIRSLKSLEFEENNLSDEGFEAIASALVAQPHLEELHLHYLNENEANENEADASFGRRGYAALGATMRIWEYPSLKRLLIHGSNMGDDGLRALVEGLANCSKLEHLDIGQNEQITVVGLRALSDLLRAKKFSLQSLDLNYMGIDCEGMNVLAAGVACIQSLKSFDLSHNPIGDEGLQSLAVGLANNKNLETVDLSNNQSFSAVGLRRFSDVIFTALNLKEVNLSNNSIDDEGLQALAAGMTNHCTLEKLDISWNAISSEGLQALTAAKPSSLRWLNLTNNAVDDDALKALVRGLEYLGIETLNLSRNRITASAVSVLTPIFRSESCSLKVIKLDQMNIEDGGAEILAEGLRGNKSLTELVFDCKNVTELGWSTFSKLLCDTSSVNNTYLSNHTLQTIRSMYDSSGSGNIPLSVQRWVRLNKQDQYDIPICKILMFHSDLDMTPFFQWKLKLLPLVLAWFERARSCRGFIGGSNTSFEVRELSAVYQFIHGLPLLVVNGFYSRKSTQAHSKKRKFDLCDK